MRKPCIAPNCPNLISGRGPRCPAHEALHQRVRNQRRTQYAGAWYATSRRARRQAIADGTGCSVCGTLDDLTLDHETGTVQCRPHNSSHRRNP